MEAFDDRHYVPVLFTKAGERSALKELSESNKQGMTPLMVVHPIPFDFVKGTPQKTIDEHIKRLPVDLTKSWGIRPIFLDAHHVERETMTDGSHPIEWLARKASILGLPVVPVTSPSHSSNHIMAVRRIISSMPDPEVCLRLDPEDWPVSHGNTALNSFIRDMNLVKRRCHLVLDLRDHTDSGALLALHTALSTMPDLNLWKSLTVTSTAMPQRLPSGRGVHEIERKEWSNYIQLRSSNRHGSRRPTFGDYVISHPDPSAEIDPRVVQISAKLKYTTDSLWLIARGGLFKANAGKSGGGAEIRPVARDLVARREFTSGDMANIKQNRIPQNFGR